MYPKLMDLYGDKGNIEILTWRAKKRGIVIEVMPCDIGSDLGEMDFDICYIGGGADKDQLVVCEDLLRRKNELVKATENGAMFLLICGGYQLWGKYYVDRSGRQIEGLGMADFYTESFSGDRCVGDVVVKVLLDGEEVVLVGFENHGGETKGVVTPLGEVVQGYGNERNGGYEGYFEGGVVGTYMHGPFLAKNPEMADWFIKKGLARNYGEVELAELNDWMEIGAKNHILDRRKILVNT
jgi:CobQ-like glutamine amidotransferase family enzyme